MTYSSFLRKVNLLPLAILVFSLYASIYVVAHGQASPPSPAALVIISGNNQIAAVGSALGAAFVVRINDSSGNPISGVTVNWAAASGGGSIAPVSSVTDAGGRASASGILGAVAGTNNNTYAATVAGLTPKIFTASASAGAAARPPPHPSFDFSLSNSGNKSVTQGSSVTITIAATRIFGDAQSVTFTISHSFEQAAAPSLSLSSCTPTCSNTITISPRSSTTPGTYAITVTGTATGGLTKTTIFIITVKEADEKTFTYPVSELGGCADNKACHDYCEKSENNRACFGFVKKHKLIPKDELDKWEEFLDVATGGGPGGCKDEKGCINYCEDALHIVECTDFVAKHNLASPQELAEMQKVAKAVKAGAALPGNCKNKTECISYCEDSAHTEACVSFLEKGGFMTEKEANLVRKFKGKSPGDCAKGKVSFAEAQRSCNAFCNDPTNQPVCFRFLEEAGIMTAEEATQAGSLSDFQACIPSAPQEIQQCFIGNLGQDLFDAMKQGVLPLEGDDIEDFMAKIRAARQCVNRFADRTLETFTDNPEALSCINSELGKDYLEKAKRGEVKCGDAAQSQKKVEACVEAAMSAKLDRCFSLACSEAITCLKGFETMGGKEKKQEINSDLKSKMESKINACVVEQIRGCLAKDCSEMTACIQKLQAEGEGKKGEGGLDPALEQELNAKMTACAKSQQNNQQPSSGQQPPEQTPQQTPQSGQIQQEYCSGFASTPSCSYVGSPDSDNYKYCKQCYPDK